MGLPQRVRHFDEDRIPEDVHAVLEATALLDITEFRLFGLAYRNWFGHPPDEKTIERFFLPYMFQDTVPSWVRHFCQRVIQLDQVGILDPVEFGVIERPATVDSVAKGYRYMFWLVAAMTVLYTLAKLATDWMGFARCMFPPCY